MGYPVPPIVFVEILIRCLQSGCLHSCECVAISSLNAFVLLATPDAFVPRPCPFARATLAAVSHCAHVLDVDLFPPEKAHDIVHFFDAPPFFLIGAPALTAFVTALFWLNLPPDLPPNLRYFYYQQILECSSMSKKTSIDFQTYLATSFAAGNCFSTCRKI